MIIRLLSSVASATLLAFLLLASLELEAAFAKKDGPTVALTKFDNALEGIFYFDDSNVILGHEKETMTVWRSADAGENWDKVDDNEQDGKAIGLWPHPFDNQRAYIIGPTNEHWITTDQGKSWRSFRTDTSSVLLVSYAMNFHGRDPKKVIWNSEICDALICERVSMYTDDDFKEVKTLGSLSKGCSWAIGTPTFAEDSKDIDDRMFCIVEGLYSNKQEAQRLVMSDDYFEAHEIEPALNEGRAVIGIISMAAVKHYLVAAAKSEGTDELALYVTVDGTQWHRAEFGQHRIEEDAYTILASTNYSLQVDVLASRRTNPMGYLFTSNSNGTYFTRNIDHTNRNLFGHVDFEMVQNIQGIVIVNVVSNWAEVEKSTSAEKIVVSKISFDDGRTFQDLMAGKENLHLHSVTDAPQSGTVFSSPAPGLVMGVGNTGKYLKEYSDGDLFVSDDAGVTWREGLNGAHLYEFGNQGAVIVAVDDEDATDELRYSIDHGKTWEKADLGVKIRPKILTTAPDSTTLKFLLYGTSGSGSKTQFHMYKIDFGGLHERTCKKDDFEKWPARVDENGKPTCVMGRKQFYNRRKADANCFIDDDFKDPEPEFEPCLCAVEDFECDLNFVRDADDRTKCLPAQRIDVPKDICKDEKGTFRGPSGWRLIPGNQCIRKGGKELDKEIDRPCAETVKKPASGDIGVEKTNFKADRFEEWYYLERSGTSQGSDETIVMRTSEGGIFLTHDHGKKWEPILEDEPIVAIVPNPHFKDEVYFLTGSKKVHYTVNRGDTFDKFEAPEPPSEHKPTLKFHPAKKNWYLWAGAVGRDEHTNIYYSKDRGDDWQTLVHYAKKCDFIPREGTPKSEKLIYCEQYENENTQNSLQLLSSDNFFADWTTHFSSILDFATMSEFIIVAAKKEDHGGLKVDASVDGRTFAAADFPKDLQVAYQLAYTVLDSSTHAVFLHVTVNAQQDREFGTIIKSNSNGTFYVLSLSEVNRDQDGYVDFEKMSGLEGVAMVNVVSNRKGVEEGEKKRLKSKITHNDGAEWALLPPPKKDALGDSYECVTEDNKATEKCSLHLHSYTERSDKSATFSSPNAVGLMVGVGNVGEYLLRKNDEATDTFITRDAGITWQSVKKGSYMWEYGDWGSIIVIVKESEPTKSIFYSLDEGQKWIEYEFSPRVEMQISAITTVPSDSSMNFVLWGREVGTGAKGGIFTVNLDFSGLEERQEKCQLDERNPSAGDYVLWEPKHPLQDSNCLFGHVSQYHRKKLDSNCYNVKEIEHLHNIERNCSCTRQDFECDYNYQIHPDGTCQLVPGEQPPDHQENCRKNPDQKEFWYPTGYRRIPLTTCEGGKALDKYESQACPGWEDDYKKSHGIGGVALFFAIVLPVAAAIGIGYWVYTRWLQGFGGFGQIRLGDTVGVAGVRSGESPWISIPVTIISGVVAVVKALPLLVMSLWRSARGYAPIGGRGGRGAGLGTPYRSRDAFASRRQDYSQVVEDDELLGEGLEEDDEV